MNDPLFNEFRNLIAEAHQRANDNDTHDVLDWLYQQIMKKYEELQHVENRSK